MQVTYTEELFVQHFTELHPYTFTPTALKAIFAYYEWEIPDFEFVPDTILKDWKEYAYGSELQCVASHYIDGHGFAKKLSNNNLLVREPFVCALKVREKSMRDADARIKVLEAELSKLLEEKASVSKTINILQPLVEAGKEKQK